MKQLFTTFVLSIAFSSAILANYTTPGTGTTFTLADLVTNSGGDVSFVGGEFFVNDTITISTNDVLNIITNETVRFAGATFLQVNGTLIINPPTSVLFTAQSEATGFHGLRFDFSSNSLVQKLTFEYASAIRIFDCSPTFNDCIIRYNTTSSTFASSAIQLFRANPVITNCQFIQNRRAAISGGANIANAPVITGCLFSLNNTLNLNVPQINLGSTGTDTAKIINCQIIGGNINSGAIGFLPIGSANAIIKQNLIRGNRYGLR